jgi:PKD repeat protein
MHSALAKGAILAGIIICLSCSTDTLYDPSQHQISRPFAFVTPDPVRTYSFSDTASLSTIDTVKHGDSLVFVGLLSNPDLPATCWWDFGDDADTQNVVAHSFTSVGMHTCYFTVRDTMQNALSDSVLVCVYSSPIIDRLIAPADSQDPDASLHFLWHSMGSVAIDTVYAQILMSEQLDALAPIASGITSSDYVYDGSLKPSTTYYWQIVIRTRFGGSDTSAVAQFRTKAASLRGPVIISIRPDTTATAGDNIPFYATATDTGASIIEYAWDFDGNDTFDLAGASTASASHRYFQTGVYSAVLRVRDSNAKFVLDTVAITVIPGPALLGPVITNIRPDTTVKESALVLFYAEAIDSGASITEYAWDFDGNGTFDFSGATTASTFHTYLTTGTYRAVLRIRDSKSQSVFDTVDITVVPPTLPPKPAIVGIRPDTTIRQADSVRFYATVQDSGVAIASYAWDFDGDGTFDFTNATAASCVHQYAAAGTFRAVLRVINQAGKQASDTVRIRVMTPSAGGPVIENIRSDTVVRIGDQVPFYATVSDTGAAITEYAWDFDANGTFDTSSSTSATSSHQYSDPGRYRAVLRVTDANAHTAADTVLITVARIHLELVYRSSDTIIDYGGTVRCSIRVNGAGPFYAFSIDTAHTGSYVAMISSGASASYQFSTGTAASWDSIRMRAVAPNADTAYAALKLRIRPRQLSITSIDSTDTSITVRWSQTQEPDFQSYCIYRNASQQVDTLSELWATVAASGTLYYATPQPGYTRTPRYYRVYQRDTQGVLSRGSNVVFGDIINTLPDAPELLYPGSDGDTIMSNATLRWNPGSDPNGDLLTYSIQINRGATGYVTVASAVKDSFFKLAGLDTLAFSANIRVVANDGHGGTAYDQRNSIAFKRSLRGRMRLVPAGSFYDSAGNEATISHDYFMDTAEVTQAGYRAMMGTNPGQPVDEVRPVNNVTWYQAIMYCNALSKSMHLDTVYTYSSINAYGAYGLAYNAQRAGVRLPTEDEWELAAKGGEEFDYATDDGTLSCEKANYVACPAGGWPVALTTNPYPPNPYGLRNLTGNVAEWCWDRFGADRPEVRRDYPGATYSSSRVNRGGDCGSAQDDPRLTTSSRSQASPSTAAPRTGFRCVIPVLQ